MKQSVAVWSCSSRIRSCSAAPPRLLPQSPVLAQAVDGESLFPRRPVFFAGILENRLYLPVKQEDDRVAGKVEGEGS
ncbi:MAG TPA: hypothetical protein VHX61_18675 [Rhizomicrobium sp.]|jgi:hypothetical protein|nr:hypothetical protein [Rhizomicrobium sp.]